MAQYTAACVQAGNVIMQEKSGYFKKTAAHHPSAGRNSTREFVTMTNDSVIAALRAALNANPDDVEVRLHLADLLIQGENYEEAEEALQTLWVKTPICAFISDGQ